MDLDLGVPVRNSKPSRDWVTILFEFFCCVVELISVWGGFVEPFSFFLVFDAIVVCCSRNLFLFSESLF